MSVRIITDSSADMPPALRGRVRAVPLAVRFGEREYQDGVTIHGAEFYEMLAQSPVLPTTSQPTPAAFEDVFREEVEAGHEVVCITIASGLSGTYQSATIAAQEFPGRVFVVDSRTVAIGAGVLTAYALELVDRGLGGEEILRELMEKRKQVRLYAIVDTLEYLKKGGRLSAAAALVGGLLNIKPIICVEEGEIRVLGSARGMKKACAMLTQECEKHGGVNRWRPMLLGYTGQSDDQLRKYREENAALWGGDVEASIVGAAIGVHAGPGAVAAAFFSVE